MFAGIRLTVCPVYSELLLQSNKLLKGHRPKIDFAGVYMHIISKFTAFLFSSFQSQKWQAIYSSVQKQKFPVLSNKQVTSYLSAPCPRIWTFAVRG